MLGKIQASDKMDHPQMYIGDKLGKMMLDGTEGLYMSMEKYVRSAM